jgi:hypothetical protein
MSDELIAEAEIGGAADDFLASDLGRCLLGMALQEVHSAQEALETVNPTDVAAIERLQNKAKLGRQFEQWLTELVGKGEEALETLKQQQEAT